MKLSASIASFYNCYNDDAIMMYLVYIELKAALQLLEVAYYYHRCCGSGECAPVYGSRSAYRQGGVGASFQAAALEFFLVNYHKSASLFKALHNNTSHCDAKSLALIDDSACVQPLTVVLSDASIDVRLKVVDLARRMKTGGVEVLIAAITNDEASVRKEAADALGRLKDERALEQLIRALNDSDESVACSAAAALCYFSDDRMVEPLVAVLQSPHHTLRRNAARAINFTDDPLVIEKLKEALQDSYPSVRAAARFSLNRIDRLRGSVQRQGQ